MLMQKIILVIAVVLLAAASVVAQESVETADPLVARMPLRFDQSDGYEMVLELGSRGKPLKACHAEAQLPREAS